MAEYLTPDSPAIDGFRSPLEKFLADNLTAIDVENAEWRVDSVDLQEVDGQQQSGTIVLCERDPVKVADSTGTVINDTVSINRLTALVVKNSDQWYIFEATSQQVEADDPPCDF